MKPSGLPHVASHRLFVATVTLFVCVCCSATGNSQESIVPPGTGEVQTFSNLTSREYQKTLDRMVPKAFRPIEIKVEVTADQPRFTVTMKHVNSVRPWLAKHGLSNRQYASFAIEQDELGYLETLHERYRVRGATYHVSVFEKDLTLLKGITLPKDPLPEDGETKPEFAPLDNMMRDFLKENQIPGATIAVSRYGTMYYARGFGYADLKSKTPMKADTRMRIASISKSITAVAVLQLVERSKLKLDEPFLPHVLKHLSIDADAVQDERIARVTILNLLQHVGGWDRDATFDPMFRSITIAKSMKTRSPASANTIIQYMLTTQNLSHEPGEKYSYSNFGYSLLGRVIEAVSGQTYFDYVQRNILKPSGMSNTQPARTLQIHRTTNEATYHMRHGETAPSIFASINRRREVPRPYGAWAIEPMDSHGGWISSAADLVRFGSEFRGWRPSSDENDSVKPTPLVTSESRRVMLAAPEFDPRNRFYYYGCGWSVRPRRRSSTCGHTGLLDGVSAILICRNDGYCWAILFNIDVTPDGKHCAAKIDALVHRAVNSIYRWPVDSP